LGHSELSGKAKPLSSATIKLIFTFSSSISV